MPVTSSRPAKKKAPRRKPLPRKRSSGRFMLVLAIPIVALAAYLAWQFLHSPAPEKEASAPKAAPLGRPSNLASRLRQAGFDKERIHAAAGKVILESFTSASDVAAHLQKSMPGATVRAQGNDIEIREGGTVERLSVRRLQRGDRGDGLEAMSEQDDLRDVEIAQVPPSPAVHPTSTAGEKRIALILDDVGFDRQPLEAAADLPSGLSFAVIPGTPNARQSADFLAGKGHEILCHLPMEPNDYPHKSPGAKAIFTSMSSDSIRRTAADGVDSIPHVRGLNNHMGSRATRDPRVMRDVLSVVKEKGLYFIDSRTIAGSVGESMARRMSVPTAGRDVFLDDVESSSAIREQLRILAARAESHGLAVGIGHIYPLTVQVLREEIPRLQARGFRFIRASEAVR
ncbi:MAG TPA: divergent polysaccharide deacetylase family protein [Thermoanaerobaculia bacterium]|nr:divergent polysaccharide deacetylase family protein [Thermoanaerobaculia bacterium]